MRRQLYFSVAVHLMLSIGMVAAAESIESSAIVSLGSGRVIVADRLGRIVDLEVDRPKVAVIADIGSRIVDLTTLSPNRLVAIDGDRRELILIDVVDGTLQEARRVGLGLDPCRLAVSPDKSSICVSGRWSRAVQLVDVQDIDLARPLLQLGFEAQEVVSLPGGRFLVADAFGGKLALVDAATGKIESQQELFGHNIRGLALSEDGSSVLASHQTLSRVARTTVDDIHWGNLIQNVVVEIPLQAFELSTPGFRNALTTHRLGDVGQGFADPTGIVALSSGFAVLSGGARQMAVVVDGKLTRRHPVGRRPTRMVRISDQRLVVMNEHDDSLSVVSLGDDVDTVTIELPGEEETISDGRVAFYDAGLSHQFWMTCNSCHSDGHSAGLLADTKGDGGFGNPKRIPSLLSASGTAPFGWLGNKLTLENQIEATLASTMGNEHFEPHDVEQLARFIGELQRLPQRTQTEGTQTGRTETGDGDAIDEGEALFATLKCVECHRPPHFTSPVSRDVGMEDERGNRKFNPPSLLGIGHRRFFLHDARTDSLRTVFRKHAHQIPADLSAAQLNSLLAYLRSL